ncbi:TetR/AcrR family transcriptional regulator [Actinocorallia longicatena]|uniref:TetR/AcrR family transcriptional regulator n=1 Tax=Actinocorallia longicatena TaxID=111803 RepID=A0ABP6QFN6_9ACTN
MTSIRHNTRRVDEDVVLDAARACVLAVGVRRTTLTDIARRANVSRMTLYRRWPDVQTIVGDLMTREWLALAEAVIAGATGDARTRLVDTLTKGTRLLREHPLLRKIIEVDPELLLPYVLTRTGASQEAFLELIEGELARGHADGSIRTDAPRRQARTLLLIVQSFALSLPTMTGPGELATEHFDADLRRVLTLTLRP